MSVFARVRVQGTPFERGVQYGTQARDQVAATRDGYQRAFKSAGIEWSDAVAMAQRYLAPIEKFASNSLQEMRGIAEGAGISFDDVLAINCRTEILWSAKTKPRGECSSFALAPQRTDSGHTYVGQNWDWLLHGIESTIVLEAEPDDAPNYVTIVEAGLLAKTLLNAAGIGIAINTLITSRDGFADGVPFHILIHQLSSSLHIFDAIETLGKLPRAASGNYMIGAPGGAIANVETAPGGPRDLSVLTGDSGVIVHTNHFVAPIAEGYDLAPVAMSDSYVRYARMDSMFIDNHAPASFEMIAERLADHTDAPGSICCHPDPRSPQPEQWSTLASVIMDVENRTLSLSEGRACDAPRNIHDYSDFLSTTDLTNTI